MAEHPPVRTFKPRRRPLSKSRSALFDRLAPRFALEATGPVLDLDAVFGRSAPVVLDIGIGVGDTIEVDGAGVGPALT